jgi:hypothetical protein
MKFIADFKLKIKNGVFWEIEAYMGEWHAHIHIYIYGGGERERERKREVK